MTKRGADLKYTICPACGLNSIDKFVENIFRPCLNQNCRSHIWDGNVGEVCYARGDIDNRPSRVFVISNGVLVIGEEVPLADG